MFALDDVIESRKDMNLVLGVLTLQGAGAGSKQTFIQIH